VPESVRHAEPQFGGRVAEHGRRRGLERGLGRGRDGQELGVHAPGQGRHARQRWQVGAGECFLLHDLFRV